MQSRMDVPDCPGFCGRVPENNSLGWSECSPCPWGTRTHHQYQCTKCESPLPGYDWCYLLFMVVVPLLINCFYVHYYSPKKTTKTHTFLEVICCLCEAVAGALTTLLLFPPRGLLTLLSCRKSGLKEWYPALFNPVIGYIKPLKCSYEIVFPLYSLPFFFLLFLLLYMLLFRYLLYTYVLRKNHDNQSFFYGLLALPKVAVAHGLLAGIIYSTFPYILIIFSLCSNAFHLAMEGKAPIREILRRLYNSPMQLLLLCVNMALLAFAIIALTAASYTYYGLFFLLVVPIPAIFYIATIGLSHPSVLTDV